jgi:hypothetical protein
VFDESGVANYRRIDVPICLVAGRFSPEPAKRVTSLLADILPHASCFEVAAGHMAPITHPMLVNPVFEEFICAVDASVRETQLAMPQFSEMTAEVRGQGWLRAIAVGLSGLVLTTLAFTASDSHAQQQIGKSTHSVYPLEESAWHEGPPGMPRGSKFAVISGDPLAAGPFVMRVRLPPGYLLPPSRQANDEELIVLAGAITLVVVTGVGEATARTLTSGSYASLAASELHFAHTKDGATLQIVGIGPFGSST